MFVSRLTVIKAYCSNNFNFMFYCLLLSLIFRCNTEHQDRRVIQWDRFTIKLHIADHWFLKESIAISMFILPHLSIWTFFIPSTIIAFFDWRPRSSTGAENGNILNETKICQNTKVYAFPLKKLCTSTMKMDSWNGIHRM